MDPFDQAIRSLPAELIRPLSAVSHSVKTLTTEIRIRAGRPLVLICRGVETLFVEPDGRTGSVIGRAVTISRQTVEEALRTMSGYSLHSVQSSLLSGFLTLPGGHRAGICGNVSLENGRVAALRRTDSINLRIARQFDGVADELCSFFRREGLSGTLIVGPPASGKTTLLKDLCRQLSNGFVGSPKKVCLIDERGEIGAVWKGEPQNDVGWNTDVLDGYPKGIGFDVAVRCFSPEVIVCDEIGGDDDAQTLLTGVNAGAVVFATVHAASFEEFLRKKNTEAILQSGAFSLLVLLRDAGHAGQIKEIACYDQGAGTVRPVSDLDCRRPVLFRTAEAAGR